MQNRFLRFAITGLGATLLHVVVAHSFIQIASPSPALANAIAFLIATTFSFALNTWWSFSSQYSHGVLLRFWVVSMIGLSLTIAIASTAQYIGLHYWYGIAFVVCLVPPVTFVLHRYWTFR